MSHTQENLPPNGICARIGDQLSAYLDGELSADEAAEVEAHLALCPDCARLCTALRGLRADIAAARLEPPAALHDRIMARVRRENRVRRLRRITAIASAGVAAMFCFVVIGGAILREQAVAFDAAPAEAGNHAKLMANADGIKFDEEAAEIYYSANSAANTDAMTGAVIDTTIEADLTIAATGIAVEHAAEEKDVSREAAPNNAPAMSEAAVSAVQSVKLSVAERDPARLLSRSAVGGFSTDDRVMGAPAAEVKPTPLDEMAADPDVRLADEQVGTLCVLALDEIDGVHYAVYDLVSGARLTLGDFLGDKDAPARYGAAADTEFRPTAAGLWLDLPDGAVTLAWTADAILSGCVARFEMTKAPLCAPK